MRIQVRNIEDGVKVVDCAGKLILGRGTFALRSSVLDCFYAGQTKISLNLGEVTRVDCAGLGELVRLFSLARQIGAELRLTNLSPRVKDLMELTKLLMPFRGSYPDEKKATANFLKEPEREREEVMI